ncbi:MAG: zinc transport system permease protein [Erysipelotrichaceae bacterium]|nr:MAG: zinc transport system permease [Erysipelotrichaceae bacterium]TXT18023.1 MAG: zinc transport system permease protein [Erysipelotrichaceae bacterium]
MSIFNYEFMNRALWVGALVAVMSPLIGQTIVLKRMSMVGDAIAHTTLAGVAIGLILNIDPLISAMVAALIGVFLVDVLRQRLPYYADVAIAILMSLGIGLAGTLSSFVRDTNRFSAFLFGSIVAISETEVIMITGVVIIVVIVYFIFYKEIFAMTFDETMAQHSGVNVKLVNAIFMIMLGITLSIAAKTVGSLILSSLMILPVATAMQLSKSYKSTLVIAFLFSLFFMLGGLFISFYAGVKPGGAVVLLAVGTYLMILPLRKGRV